jgi:tetratricopeptide (TPR) repeat protein
MADDHSRIDDLRRRVEKDPASIAFASLAEELRKAGEHDEAVRVCRTGLERHPTYLSARVTLGRALLALQQYGDARTEIEYVLRAAPDNLLALKCRNELEAHSGEASPEPAEAGPHGQSASEHVQSTPEPAKLDLRVQAFHEPAKVEPVAPASPEPPPPTSARGALSGVEGPRGDGGASAEAAEPAPVMAVPHVPDVSAPPNGGPPPGHPAIGELEEWQSRIQADRARRAGGPL